MAQGLAGKGLNLLWGWVLAIKLGLGFRGWGILVFEFWIQRVSWGKS
jgi:hypothetical protein